MSSLFFSAFLLLSDLSLVNAHSSDFCTNYTIAKVSSGELSLDLFEMSGLLSLGGKQLAHVQDSGNDPFLILTDRSGKVEQRIRFAEVSTDPEELARGVCPFNEGSCIYVMDTGDNFGWRGTRNIWAIEESTMKTAKPRIENLIFTFPGAERIDSEAAAVVGKTIFLFAKEKKHARVFALDLSAWKDGPKEAKQIADLPYTMLTGASATKD
ncbi:MAG: hypothetical protein EOP10_12835, partial [Proteobacteria bacterium]